MFYVSSSLLAKVTRLTRAVLPAKLADQGIKPLFELISLNGARGLAKRPIGGLTKRVGRFLMKRRGCLNAWSLIWGARRCEILPWDCTSLAYRTLHRCTRCTMMNQKQEIKEAANMASLGSLADLWEQLVSWLCRIIIHWASISDLAKPLSSLTCSSQIKFFLQMKSLCFFPIGQVLSVWWFEAVWGGFRNSRCEKKDLE